MADVYCCEANIWQHVFDVVTLRSQKYNHNPILEPFGHHQSFSLSFSILVARLCDLSQLKEHTRLPFC